MTLPATIAQRGAQTVTLPLSEVFGPTFQGEGPHAGRRCGFVRLGLCNLACEWCDTPYTWDSTRYDVAKECPDTDVEDIADKVTALGVDLMVLSGGEPLMHRAKLRDLFRACDAGCGTVTWHVETNGTIPPPTWWAAEVAHTTVSPKINTGDRESKRLRPLALAAWAALSRQGKAAFKFVVTDVDDIRHIDDLAADFDIFPESIWVMPEGTTSVSVLRHHRDIADAVLTAGYNTSTRLHVLLWDNTRGV